MASSIARAVIAGPQRIIFGGIDVGHTLDGVTLSAEREFTEVNVDRYGKTPLDLVLTGNNLTLKFKLAQADWDQWNIAIPETGSYDGSGNKDRIDFGADAGASLRAEAKTLVMHPTRLDNADLSEDVNIYLAVSAENIEVPFKIDEQKVIEVTMKALVSEAYGTGRRLGHYGPADVS